MVSSSKHRKRIPTGPPRGAEGRLSHRRWRIVGYQQNYSFNAAGEMLPERGFKTCHDCGVVEPENQQDAERLKRAHRYWCSYRQAGATEEWNNLYLYRQVESEALRILLPVSTLHAERKMATFKACLELAMRKRFRGRPSHLIIREYSEAEGGDDGSKRRYLVLYDTVPGGTGYLKEFARNPEALREALQAAHDAMISCECRQLPGGQHAMDAHQQRHDEELEAETVSPREVALRDGCYRCVYAYQRQHELVDVSREEGIQLLGRILADWQKLRPVPTLGQLGPSDELLESELEEQFIAALKQWAENGGHSWEKTLRDGRYAYLLRFSEQQRQWLIAPQVRLGPSDGIERMSQPDFLIQPLDEEPGVLPVAVFTDGLAYHVRPGLPTSELPDDIAKRTAIWRSERYLCWSVTWQDVERFNADAEAPGHTLFSELALNGAELKAILKLNRCALDSALSGRSAVSSLVSYLKAPQPEEWRKLAVGALVHMMQLQKKPLFRSADALAELELALHEQTSAPRISLGELPEGQQICAGYQSEAVSVLVSAPQKAFQGGFNARLFGCLVRLEDLPQHRESEGYGHSWRMVLNTVNLLQFLPQLDWICTTLVQQEQQQESWLARLTPTDAPQTADHGDLPAEAQALAELVDESCLPLLQQLAERGLALPVVGYEHLSSSGAVSAEAELAWPEQRVAVLLARADESWGVLEAESWALFEAHTLIEDFTPLLGALS